MDCIKHKSEITELIQTLLRIENQKLETLLNWFYEVKYLSYQNPVSKNNFGTISLMKIKARLLQKSSQIKPITK